MMPSFTPMVRLDTNKNDKNGNMPRNVLKQQLGLFSRIFSNLNKSVVMKLLDDEMEMERSKMARLKLVEQRRLLEAVIMMNKENGSKVKEIERHYQQQQQQQQEQQQQQQHDWEDSQPQIPSLQKNEESDSESSGECCFDDSASVCSFQSASSRRQIERRSRRRNRETLLKQYMPNSANANANANSRGADDFEEVSLYETNY